MYAGNVNCIRIQQNDQLAMEYARAKGTSIKEFAERKGISNRRMDSILRNRNMKSHLTVNNGDRHSYTKEKKAALVAEFEERRKRNPMLSQAIFAKEKGINISTFGNWIFFARKKEAAQMAAKEEAMPKAIEVREELEKGHPVYRFKTPSISLECYRDLAIDEIERIARLLGSLR